MYLLRRTETPSSEEKVTHLIELMKNVKKEGNPKLCEGLIRELHKKIQTVEDENAKDQLLTELKIVSYRGLHENLKTIVEENGLALEGLDLVLNYLTTKNELAEYLFRSANVVKNEGLNVVKRRLAPKLEVLGGLTSMQIDVEKPTRQWARNLIEKAPSLSALARIPVGELEKICNGTNHGEMEDVNRLVKIALSRTKQHSSGQEDDQELGAKHTTNNGIDKEKLKEVKALMDEAKKAAKEQSEEAKKDVKEKIAKITKMLELPSDWNKQDSGAKPDELFKELDNIIGQFNNAVEVSQSYTSDLDVVEKASGGRALCGIYHSKYVAPITAERPLIGMPAKVTLSSPNNSQQIRYVKFSKSRVAANYVNAVKSSSTNIGLNVGGFSGLFVGDVRGGYASEDEEGKVTSKKKSTSSASVVQYIWIATKTFKIEQEQMKLSKSAQRMASSIVKNEKQSVAARCFMERYGSHFPAGLHTLGGVLFRIVDAKSDGKVDTSKLTEAAATKLQGQLSAGYFGGASGIAGSVSGEHSSSSGETSAKEEKADSTSYTYSFQAMGPSATDPTAFSKLLTNNSTWAVIDRGSHHAYIPVWELVRALGKDFEEPAKLLEKTWNDDEEWNKKRSRRVEYKIVDIVMDDLKRLKNEYIEKKPNENDYGHWPQNSAQLVFNACFDAIDLTREQAYEKALEIIMVDPRYRICAISWCDGDKYTVRCWKAHATEKMKFERGKGEHVLFYSKMLFKWKDDIPTIE